MAIITVDDSVAAVLAGLPPGAILRDRTGRVLGRFTPDPMTEEEIYANARDLFDLEEMKRRKIAECGKGRPLSEILLARLEELERNERAAKPTD